MSIEGAVFNFIKTNVPLISNRIYAAYAPQAVAKPYIVYMKVSAPREYYMEGPQDIVRARFQFSVYATGYSSCKAVVKELQDALSGFSGAMGTVSVPGAFYDNEQDAYEEDTGLFHCPVDYFIWHKE